MSEEEMPPLTNEPISEGTDIDAAFKKAQDERKLNNWYGIEPGKLATDEQMQAMQDHQDAMDQREMAPRNPEDAIEVKPLDETQEKQAQQSDDLEYLTGLFQESSDAEHQATAWKLLDEFIDKYEMTREQERALRGHIIDVSKNAPANTESGSENIDSNTDTSTNVIEDSNIDTDTPQAESADEKPDDLDAEADRILQELKDKRAAEAAAAEAESKEEGAEESAEPGDSDVTDDDTTGEDKEQPSGVYDWEEEERKEKEALENGEEDPDSDEKERKNLFERAKDGYYRLMGRIELYFNGGTPEQNRNRKLAAGGIAVLVVGGLVLFGVAAHNNAQEAASVTQNVDFANLHGVQGGEIFTAGADVASQATTGSPEVASQVAGALQEQLSGSGDTIWYHAREALQEWGVKPTNANILRLTRSILQDNSLSWDAARHLPNGFDFVINKADWIAR